MVSLAIAFLPFAFVSAFTPGPNNLMLAASGANFGMRRTFPHISGIVAGFPLLVLAVGLGLGTLFQRHPEIHAILKIVGATFLLYLAWRIARAGYQESEGTRGRPLTFLEAALFQWVNPKAWVVAVTAIATYTTVGGAMYVEIPVILTICLVVSLGSATTWTLFGVGLNRLLQDSPRTARIFNTGMGLLLAASIIPMMN